LVDRASLCLFVRLNAKFRKKRLTWSCCC
jgi:hypothetical protein